MSTYLVQSANFAAVMIALSSLATAQGLPVAKPEQIGLSSAALERIEPEMQAYVDGGRVAGMVMMIARHGKVGYAKAIGYADLTTRVPLRTDAVFRTASTRKPMLAAATMVLVDSGRIRLDDPISKYIPSFARVQVFAGGSPDAPQLVPPGKAITIRHLLTHTSGVASGSANMPVDAIYERSNLRASKRSLAEVADALAAIPLEFSPGDAWHYSPSFEVIARLLEVASGQSLEVFLREKFLLPLGATDTWLDVNPAVEARLPALYQRDADGKLTPRTPEFFATTTMVSTPSDFIRLGQMLLGGGMLDGRRILSRQSVEEILKNQLPPELTPITTPVWDHRGYGFGLGGGVLVEPTVAKEPALRGTYRWAGNTGTMFWVDPAADLVALVWTQSRAGYWLEHHFQRLVYDAIEPKQ